MNKHYTKIMIIGCSGSGKTTLAGKIAAELEIEPTYLDTIRFTNGPTSEKRSDEAFIKDVASLSKKDTWVIEGIYYKLGIEDILWAKADLVIWLDLPLRVIEYRVWKRSLGRFLTRGNMTSGKKVSWKSEFGKGGIVRVVHKIHKATRKHYPPLLKSIEGKTEIMHIQSSRELKAILRKVTN